MKIEGSDADPFPSEQVPLRPSERNAMKLAELEFMPIDEEVLEEGHEGQEEEAEEAKRKQQTTLRQATKVVALEKRLIERQMWSCLAQYLG